jgi:hypothetical protein
MNDVMIEAEGLMKRYGPTEAVAGGEPAGAIRNDSAGTRRKRRRQDDHGADADHSNQADAGRAWAAGHDVVREAEAVQA